MATMRNVTLGVWIAGLGLAAVLTCNANRPRQIASGASQVDEPTDLAGGAEVASVPEVELEPVLYMPDVTILGRAHPERAGLLP
jgi:hypothetical protein